MPKTYQFNHIFADLVDPMTRWQIGHFFESEIGSLQKSSINPCSFQFWGTLA